MNVFSLDMIWLGNHIIFRGGAKYRSWLTDARPLPKYSLD